MRCHTSHNLIQSFWYLVEVKQSHNTPMEAQGGEDV
jgi:hypothetical protein